MDKQLRHMSARVMSYKDVIVAKNTNDAWGVKYCYIDNAIILKSYNSVVAVYNIDNGFMFLLPRYDYSVTTLRHIRAFFEDYAPHIWYDLKDIRREVCDNVILVDRYGFDESYMQAW